MFKVAASHQQRGRRAIRGSSPRYWLRRTIAASVCIGVVAAGLPAVSGVVGVQAAPVGQGFNLNTSDLRFILQQIKIAEQHAATATATNPCGTLIGTGANQIPAGPHAVDLPWGLRTVDGSCNNLITSQNSFGNADQVFPRLSPANFINTAEGDSYQVNNGVVIDSQPRRASNLVVDQTDTNPAAVAAYGVDDPLPVSGETLFIPNTAPDVGLSAPYNSWFTLFGQFFDHGLDLTSKGGSGIVFVPLEPEDPLFDAGLDGTPATPDDGPNFMILTRSTNQPGPDGILGNGDDIKEATNQTSPFVDQSQTYTSHPSHQVFLRKYETNGAGLTVATGGLLEGVGGGMSTWADVKAQSADLLGIQLVDMDVFSIPLLKTDPYGRYERGPNGYPLIVTAGPGLDLDGNPVLGEVEGDPSADGGKGVLVPANAVKTGHAFLDDIAHHATPSASKTADADVGTVDDHVGTTYDDEMLNAHFMAGDGRVNENIGLIAVHHVFHAEHNRLTTNLQNVINASGDAAFIAEWKLADTTWNGERIFQAARFVTEMEYQHLAFEEFARKVQPMVNVFAGYDSSIDSAITAEFAHAVYRFGHSMLTETVARTTAGGGTADIPLLDAFLNPPSFQAGGLTADQAAGNIVRGMTRQVGNELDEFVTEALRNRLLGLPLDLATLNIARAREAGVGKLNDVRASFYNTTGDPSLAPYANWADFGLALRHPESLVNFVAAYGIHATITGDIGNRRSAAADLVAFDAAFMNGPAASSGLDDVDLWLGGLAEKPQPFGGLLGNTFNYVFELQMENLQDGDRFYYLSRTAGLNLLVQLEGNSFAELIHRNSDAEGLPADVFSRPDFIFNLAAQTNPGGIVNDPDTAYDETLLLFRMSDGTIRFNGGEHVVFNGTSGEDAIWSSEGDDTIRGNELDDWMEGGSGNDQMLGGDGDDIMNDLFGDDVLKGGDGDDAISSGRGFDLNQAGLGNDFVYSGNDPTETFGGPGNDFIFAGDSSDTVFGDDGDDWIEGGGQADLLQGDNGAPFQDDPNTPGHDVIDGDGGNDDYDAEGGDDIMVAGPGIERNEGMLGFDWVTHESDPQPGNSDMNFTGLLPPSLDAFRDRFDLVEGLSGWDFDDILRGDDFVAADMVGHELNAAGIARIDGLAGILPVGATGFTGGNILLGGDGSDILEGRGGNDIIHGDSYLNVRISVRDAGDPGLEIDTVESMSQIRGAIFAGTIKPGQLRIVREILPTVPEDNDLDSVVFSDVRANYTFTPNAELMTVAHTGGTGLDGIDTLWGIERLVFTDQTVVITNIPNNTPATGSVSISDTTPSTADTLSTTNDIADADGMPNPFTFEWQVESPLNSDLWSPVSSGPTFTPTAFEVGLRLRVVITFLDGDGVVETKTSAATEPVTGVPGAPIIGVATAGAPETGTATVNWSAPLSNGGSPITGYVIQVLDSADVQVGALRPAAGNATSLVVNGLTFFSTYHFRVAATNAIGTGNQSGDSNVVTPLGDVVAPTVTATSPVDGAINVAAASNVTATFSENVTGVSGASFTLRPTLGGANVAAGVTYSAATRTATLNPTANLAQNTQYTASLTGGVGGILDTSGNPLADVEWTFTTFADVTPPTVIARAPAAGAINVAANANVRADFSEPVSGVSTTTFTLVNAANVQVPAAVTYFAGIRRAVLNPTVNLAPGTYTATLTSGITDTAGNPLVLTSWSFTVPAPNVAPTVIARTPAINAVGVSRAISPTATFSEPVTGISNTTVRLRRVSNNALISAVVTYNAITNTVTLNPNTNLAPNVQYRMILTGGATAIRDLGTPAAPLVTVTWTFRTGA